MVEWRVTPADAEALALLQQHTPAAKRLTAAALDHAVAAWADGELVGLGGVEAVWEGVGTVWLILVPGSLEHSPARLRHAIRTMRLVMADAWVTRGYWRMHAMCHADSAVNCKLAEHLGGIREARLHRFGPDGTDFYLYAWVKE